MSFALFFLYFGISTAADCYRRNGEVAVADNGQPYVQCPGYDFCCLATDTCSGINGLCQDVNNHNDGSLTGSNNYTGLYQTVACINDDFSGCNAQCLPTDSIRQYIWACDDSLSTYCCDEGSLAQFSCCNNGQNFQLDAAVPAGSERSTTSSSATATPSSMMTASSTDTIPTSTTSDSAASVSAASGSPSETASQESSGLSQGAQIGIGVGVGGGIIIFAIVAFIFWRRRRSRNRTVKSPELVTEHYAHSPSPNKTYMPEVKNDGYTSVYQQKPQVERIHSSELSSGREPQELPAFR